MKKFFSFVAATLVALTMNAQAISVADAIAAANALEDGATGTEEVTVEGFVVDAQDFSWGSKQQIFFLADDAANSGNQVFEAYYCTAKENGEAIPVLNGDKVKLTGKLTKYVKDANVTPEIKNGVAEFVSKVEGDRSKPEAASITVAKALELGASIEQGKTGTETYTIVGYVTAFDGKNTEDGGWAQYKNQIFWIADTKGSTAKSNAEGGFEVYQGVCTEEVHIGDKVSVYTKIKNYNGILESETKAPVTMIEKGEGGGETPVEDADVVFTAADFAGQGQEATLETPGGAVSVTKDGVTVSTDNGFGHNLALRVYKGAQFAITSSEKQIGKIVFQFYSNYDGGLQNEVVVNAKEFVVASLDKQARVEKISIYFGTAEVPVIEPITVAKALEIAQALTPDVKKSETTAETYAVQGFIVGTSSKNENTWYMADEAGAYGEFQAYKCKSVDYEVAEGELVIVTGKISTYHGEGSNGEYYSYEISGGALKHVYGQGLDKVEAAGKAQKVMIDGVVYILRDGKMFNTLGTQVR